MTLDAKPMNSTPVETEFYDYYGFSYSPFSDYPHEVSFFQGEERQSLLEQLQHLSRYSHAMTAVVGEQGVGKTFICQELLKHKDKDIEYSVVSAVVLMSDTQFVTEIIQGFSIPIKENSGLAELQNVLLNHIDNRIRDDNHCVITVDNAHELSAEAIQVLMELLNQNDQNLHVILFGEQQLDKLLHHIDHSQLNIGATNFLQLQPLTEEGVRQYIEFRLSQAGYSGEIPLLDKQIENIYKKSAGIPREINIHTHNQLIENISQPASAKLGLPVAHMVALVITAVLLFCVFFLGGQDDHKPLQPAMDSQDLLALERTQPPDDMPQSDGSRDEVKKIVTSILEENDDEPFDLNAVNADHDKIKVSTEENDHDLQVGNQQLRQEQAIVMENIRNENINNLKETTPVPVNHYSQDQLKSAKDNTIENTNTGENANIIKNSNDNSIKDVAAKAEKSKLDATKQASELARQSIKNTNIQKENWILNMDPEHFTLQILGSHSEQSVKSYINSFENKKPFSYFETTYKSQGWFVIIYGQYSNRQQALADIPKLHRKLRKQKPWVRSIATIHEDIRKYRNN